MPEIVHTLHLRIVFQMNIVSQKIFVFEINHGTFEWVFISIRVFSTQLCHFTSHSPTDSFPYFPKNYQPVEQCVVKKYLSAGVISDGQSKFGISSR